VQPVEHALAVIEDNPNDSLIFPEALFPVTRRRHPSLAALIDDAEAAVPGMTALAQRWARDHVKSGIPVQPDGQSLCFDVRSSRSRSPSARYNSPKRSHERSRRTLFLGQRQSPGPSWT
jgi:hypothetical protein